VGENVGENLEQIWVSLCFSFFFQDLLGKGSANEWNRSKMKITRI
jgi:hypothetical protein